MPPVNAPVIVTGEFGQTVTTLDERVSGFNVFEVTASVPVAAQD